MAIVNWQPLKRHLQRAHWKPFAVVILLEVLFALVLFRSPGTIDVPEGWMRWIDGLLKYGLINGYRVNDTDYPPGSSLILLFIAKIAATCSIDVFLSFKISLGIALLFTTLCYWGWTLDAALTGLLAFSLYLNGVALGYLDTYVAPALILSLWALQQKKIGLFSLLFSVSCLIKWQPLIIAPFLALHALSAVKRRPGDIGALAVTWLRLPAPALAVVLCAVATFGYRPIAAALYAALNDMALSGKALNFNWLVTYFLRLVQPDRYGAISNGAVYLITIDPSEGWVRTLKLVFLLFYLGALGKLFKMRRSFASAIDCSLAGYLSYFILNIGVHENHLFLATILATVGAALASDKRLRAVLVVALSNLNLIAFFGFIGSPLPFSRVVGLDVTLIFAAVNVLLFLFFWGDLVLRGGSARDGDHVAREMAG